ncbi:MAG: HD-GYP domain-containing protein [Gammaproteobacteria bacterium]|nr:HD-GYP domain-containing protein [Gammaproteobacteria bacterium]MDP6616221.1 HD-GYP domain-containing protein [Gammaproteobacteria bacterium]MDP6695571.1 HD-GYP domain-containing protein [Gammaproteobacteria bacterium]
MRRVKIDTANLIAGMYVAQLDRPWLETPFLFQGFEIRDDSEIDLLKHYCRHVYIDVMRGSVSEEEIKKYTDRSGTEVALKTGQYKPKVAPRPTLKHHILSALSKIDPTGRIAHQLEGSRTYRIKTPIKREMPQAMAAYEVAMITMNNVLEHVREGRTVDVGQVQEAAGPIINSVLRNPGAMGWFVLLNKRDEYAYSHSIASSVWAVVLGRHLGFDHAALEMLALGGMLLDIGKACIPEALLRKTDKLTNVEKDLLARHVEYGLELVSDYPGIGREVLDMIGSHHERLDGSGYPDGLQGSDIHAYGRIAGLVDCYDAMTGNRPYAAAMSSYDAVCELNALAEVHFQKELVEQFVQALGMFPTGSIVELNSGEVGIVVEQNRVRRLRPKVMLVLSPDKQPLKKNPTVDLRKVSGDASKRNSRWILKGYESGAFGIDPGDYFIV